MERSVGLEKEKEKQEGERIESFFYAIYGFLSSLILRISFVLYLQPVLNFRSYDGDEFPL